MTSLVMWTLFLWPLKTSFSGHVCPPLLIMWVLLWPFGSTFPGHTSPPLPAMLVCMLWSCRATSLGHASPSPLVLQIYLLVMKIHLFLPCGSTFPTYISSFPLATIVLLWSLGSSSIGQTHLPCPCGSTFPDHSSPPPMSVLVLL